LVEAVEGVGGFDRVAVVVGFAVIAERELLGAEREQNDFPPKKDVVRQAANQQVPALEHRVSCKIQRC